MGKIGIILASVVAALCATRWIYFKVLAIARKQNIVDKPDARKLQKRPVPVLGGIAVFFGFVVGVLTGASVFWLQSGSLLRALAPVICAMTVMIYTGVMDDIVGLSPRTRFAVEILTVLGLIYASGCCIDSFHGLWGIGAFSWWIAVPLTVFAGVGIINAVNMIDGVNGLSSGLCILCCVIFGITFVRGEDFPDAVLAFTMSAALLPFFFHNVFGKKSRMFIGDAGTMMMGVLLVWFVIAILHDDSPFEYPSRTQNYNLIAMTLSVLSVPVFDTVRVMLQRMAHGKSPFHPDKTHLHHVFVRAGVSHSVTTLLEITIDFVITLIWAVCATCGVGLDTQLYLVVASSLLLVWGVYFFIRSQEKRHTELMHRLTRFGIKSHLGHTALWLRIERLMDAPAASIEETAAPAVAENETSEAEDSHLAKNREMVYGFLKGKAEVYVDDIKRRSGADSGLVDFIVGQGIEDGLIQVVKQGVWGVPLIVAMKEE